MVQISKNYVKTRSNYHKIMTKLGQTKNKKQNYEKLLLEFIVLFLALARLCIILPVIRKITRIRIK